MWEQKENIEYIELYETEIKVIKLNIFMQSSWVQFPASHRIPTP